MKIAVRLAQIPFPYFLLYCSNNVFFSLLANDGGGGAILGFLRIENSAHREKSRGTAPKKKNTTRKKGSCVHHLQTEITSRGLRGCDKTCLNTRRENRRKLFGLLTFSYIYGLFHAAPASSWKRKDGYQWPEM